MRIFAVITLIKTRLAAFVGGSLGQKTTAETVTIPKPADKICDAKYFCLIIHCGKNRLMDWLEIQKQGVAMLDKWLGRVGQLDKLSTSALAGNCYCR